MDKFGFWVTKTTQGAIWTVVRTYAMSGRRMPLFLVQMYEGTIGRMLCKLYIGHM
jgi:hypothetical protein